MLKHEIERERPKTDFGNRTKKRKLQKKVSFIEP